MRPQGAALTRLYAHFFTATQQVFPHAAAIFKRFFTSTHGHSTGSQFNMATLKREREKDEFIKIFWSHLEFLKFVVLFFLKRKKKDELCIHHENPSGLENIAW